MTTAIINEMAAMTRESLFKRMRNNIFTIIILLIFVTNYSFLAV